MVASSAMVSAADGELMACTVATDGTVLDVSAEVEEPQ
jgi:hypothetical protein